MVGREKEVGEGVVMARWIVVFLFLGLWLAPLSAYALQRRPTPSEENLNLLKRRYSLRGTVVNARTLRPVAEAKVTLRTKRGPVVWVVYTDGQGRFQMDQINFGPYVVEVQKEAYRMTEEEIHLVFGTSVFHTMSILLQPATPFADPAGAPGASVGVEELLIPPRARSEFDKGLRALNEKNQPDASEKHFRKAIDLYAAYDEAYNQLSLAHLLQNETEAAQEVLLKAVAVNEKNARAHSLLGISYRNQRRYEESAHSLRRAVELDPESSLSHMELAKSLLALRQTEEAGVHARKSHELNSASPDIHLVLYTALVRGNQYKEALAELEEFLNDFPGHSRIPEMEAQKEKLLAFLASRKP